MANKKDTQNPAVDTKGKVSTDSAEDEEDGDYRDKSSSGRGPGAGKDYRKPKNTKGTLVRLMGYIMQYKVLLLLGILFMIGASVTNLAASYFLKPIIDDYIVPNIGAAQKDWSGLDRTLLTLAGIYVLGIICNYGQQISMMYCGQKSINRLRRDLFDKLQGLPISYYDQNSNGDIMSRFTNDADSVQMALENTVLTFISSILTFIGTIAIMIYLNYKLFLITLVALVVDYFIVKKIGAKSKKMYKLQQKALGNVNAYVEEMVEGIRVVKAFTYEKSATTEFDRRNVEYRDAAINAQYYGMIIMPVLHQFMCVAYAVTTVVGAIMVLTGAAGVGGAAFTVGALGTFLTYTKQVAMPINQVSNQVVSLMSAIAGAERIFNVMDTEPEVDEGEVTLQTNPDGSLSWNVGGRLTPMQGHVQVQNIDFSYVENKPVLKHLSVEALPGQKIAFVGSTGAGKTTITNLINRFYDVNAGQILYDGIDVRDIKKDDLRKSMVVILQDTHLFTGTIMENIRYGRLDASDEDCIEAAKTANAYEFIMGLPDGFQTEITGDGSNLSQGQRQLLNISRAAVAKPPVLIMDEATSSIDTRTEQVIQQGIDRLLEGRTVFIIAHRLSTVRSCTKIAVIEAGEIIEFGSHHELLDKGGRYYELYTGQHSLEENDVESGVLN
mgnify:CR=1 FL=1